MAPRDAARQDINKRLHDALDVLRKDCLRVEIWATALTGFSQPVPDYDPFRENVLPPKNDNSNGRDDGANARRGDKKDG